MRALVFAVAVASAVLVGCGGGVSLRRWDAASTQGMVVAGLCPLCAEPDERQIEQAQAKMASKCGPLGARVDREGTQTSEPEAYYESHTRAAAEGDSAYGSSSTSAGTKRSRYYYWEFACR